MVNRYLNLCFVNSDLRSNAVAKYTVSAVRPLAVKAFSMTYKLNDLGQIIETLSRAFSSSVGEYSKINSYHGC